MQGGGLKKERKEGVYKKRRKCVQANKRGTQQEDKMDVTCTDSREIEVFKGGKIERLEIESAKVM